jgi:hypothetical protein
MQQERGLGYRHHELTTAFSTENVDKTSISLD